MDEATVIMAGLKPERVLEAVDARGRAARAGASGRSGWSPDYDADNVSRKVVRIILSYTDYVNRTVWRKA